jgi:hypothetical protein
MSGIENTETGSRIVSTCMRWGLFLGMLLVSSQAWAVEFAGGAGEPESPFENWACLPNMCRRVHRAQAPRRILFY